MDGSSAMASIEENRTMRPAQLVKWLAITGMVSRDSIFKRNSAILSSTKSDEGGSTLAILYCIIFLRSLVTFFCASLNDFISGSIYQMRSFTLIRKRFGNNLYLALNFFKCFYKVIWWLKSSHLVFCDFIMQMQKLLMQLDKGFFAVCHTIKFGIFKMKL